MVNRVLFLFLLLLSYPIYAISDTLQFSAGSGTLNSIQDQKSRVWLVSDSIPLTDTTDIEVGYMNEGHKTGIKRDGILVAGDFWRNIYPNWYLGATAGGYIADSTLGTISYTDSKQLDFITGFSVKYNVDNNWNLIGRWVHVLTFSNLDADVFTLGVGFTPK